MSDYYLQKFWQDVKDPSWPNVSTYDDFINLDSSLIDECIQQHGLKQRLDEIEDSNYWRIRNLGDMFIKDNFVFFNVPKCGSRHYHDFFLNRLNWERYYPESIDDLKGLVKFGLMMHPLDRYLKGLTEFLWQFRLSETIDIERFVMSAYMPDIHSISYYQMFGNLVDDIHWIPFKLMEDREVKTCMNNLFSRHDSLLQVPVDHPPIHVSGPEKKELNKKITQCWLARQEPKKIIGTSYPTLSENLYLVYYAYAQDLKFYRSLADVFKHDWSHIK